MSEKYKSVLLPGFVVIFIIAIFSFSVYSSLTFSPKKEMIIEVIRHEKVMNSSRVYFYKISQKNSNVRISDLCSVGFTPGYDFIEGEIYHIIYQRRVTFADTPKYPFLISVKKIT